MNIIYILLLVYVCIFVPMCAHTFTQTYARTNFVDSVFLMSVTCSGLGMAEF